MEFVARTDELDGLSRAASSPKETALLFTGEHGIGKSRLLRAGVMASPIRAVLVQANPAEADWDLSGFTAIFAALDDPRAVEFGGRFELSSADPAALFAAARDVLTLLRGFRLAPLLVAIDDVDKMDQVSQAMIGFIASRLTGTGLRLVATATELGPDDPLAGFPVHAIAPLHLGESIELLGLELGPAADPGVVRVVAARSGGNPLLLEQALKTLEPAQATGHEALVLPIRPPEASWSRSAGRIAALPAATAAMAEEIAMAPVSLVAALVHDDLDRVDALEDALFWRIAEVHGTAVRIREPLLRSYLYWHLDPHRRRELHRDLAHASVGADELSRVWHESFSASEPASGPELLLGAVQLVAHGDVDSAVEFAERAVLIDRGSAAQPDALLTFARVLTDRGELDLASHYLRHAYEQTPSASLTLRLAITGLRLEFERHQRVSRNDVEAVVSQFGDHDPAGAVEVLALAATYHGTKWEVDSARHYLRLASLFLPELEPPAATVLHGTVRMIDAVDGIAERHSDTSRTSTAALLQLPVPTLLSFGAALCWRERYGQARRVMNVVFRTHHDERLARGWAWNLAFVNEVRAGDFYRAHSVVESWLAQSPPVGLAHAAGALAATWHALGLGRPEEAVAQGERCAELAESERHPAVLARLYALQGADALRRQDNDEALRLLQLADATSSAIENLSMVRHGADLVEAAVLAGHPRDADEMLQRMSAQQSVRPTAWLDQALGRARALAAPDHLAQQAFETALALPADDYEAGRSHLAHAHRLHRLGLRNEADHAIAQATARFTTTGAPLWAARAASDSRAPDDESAGMLARLNAEERAIVELVRQGLHNREIAALLFLSLRTVELRLTTIYRKAGARSRAHLASLLS